jgi:hypothetical protein
MNGRGEKFYMGFLMESQEEREHYGGRMILTWISN